MMPPAIGMVQSLSGFQGHNSPMSMGFSNVAQQPVGCVGQRGAGMSQTGDALGKALVTVCSSFFSHSFDLLVYLSRESNMRSSQLKKSVLELLSHHVCIRKICT
jgi:hypothetical protein